jgi:transglutaminase-like putative cysteine protease
MQAQDAATIRSATRETLSAGGLTAAAGWVQVGLALEQAGLLAEALQLFRTLSGLCPNRASAWQGLARLLYQTRPIDEPAAGRALSRAQELEPTDAALRAALALRAGPAVAPSGSDVALLAEPATFLARRQPGPLVGQVYERTLHAMKVVVMHPDRRVSELTHFAREVVVEPRGQQELAESFWSSDILRARIHRPDGSVAFPREQVARGGSTRLLWPELHSGDVVEVAYRTWTRGPVGGRGDAPYYFWVEAGALVTRPLLHTEVIVISPQEHPLAVDVVNGKAEREHSEVVDGNLRLHLIWERPPNVPEEPLAPVLSEVVPVVLGSSFGDWSDFRRWYQGAVAGFTEPDAQIQKLAAELTAGKTRREDKLRALFNYVADTIRYVNYVSAEAWLPNRPQQLLARKQGDCDDKAILLITLLRAIGIQATEVLVQTRHTSRPALLSSKKVALPLFDHGIAYLPGAGEKDAGGGIWLDATGPESRLGPLPAMDARAAAFFIDLGPAEVQPSPVGSAADNGVSASWTIHVAADSSGELEADEQYGGSQAYHLRGRLAQKDTRQQGVEELLARYFPTVQVKPGIDFEPELAAGTARLRYHARLEGMARRETHDLLVPLASTGTLAAAYAPLLTRTLPVVLPSMLAPSHSVQTIRITAPAGFRPGVLPTGGTEDGGAFGVGSMEIRTDPADPRSVLVTRTLTIEQSTIPAAQYVAWRSWLQRVDGISRRSIRFVPEEGVK